MPLARGKAAAAAVAATVAAATLAACGPHGAVHSQAGGSVPVSPTAPATPSTRSASAGSPTPGPSQTPSNTATGSPASTASGGASSGRPTQSPSDSTTGSASASGEPTAGTGAGGTGAGGTGADAAIQYRAAGGGRTVALTFDDGPDPRWTPQVLRLLAEHNARATFCELGPNAQRFPYLVKEITTAGDRLCDHSVHHDERQSSKSLDYNTHEIVDAQHEISAAAGPDGELWYYRAPGGDFSPAIRQVAAEHGLRPLGWTDDSNDWRRPGVSGILANVDARLRPGAIILMHDGGGDRTQTVQALARLLGRLDAEGYSYGFPGR